MHTPSHLRLTAVLTASITTVLSVVYVVLCSIAVLYRTQCDVGDPDSVSGSDYFLNVMFRVYIQQEECANAIIRGGLTQSHTVFLLTSVTLVSSGLCFISSIHLLLSVTGVTGDHVRYLHLVVYEYVGLYIASLIVDITFAVHFGMDYAYISRALDASSAGLGFNYMEDTVRLGAFVLMTVALKGFVAHAINLSLVGVLLHDIRNSRTNKPANKPQFQHSIHKLGPLNGYMAESNPDPEVDETYTIASGSFMTTQPFSTVYERSESWQRAGVPEPRAPQASRPFSYVLEPRTLPPAPAAEMPARAEAQWRGDRVSVPASTPASASEAQLQWRGERVPNPASIPTAEAPPPQRAPAAAQWRGERVPIPAPDYSPHQPRRYRTDLPRTVFT